MVMTSWPRVNEDTTDAQYAEFFNSIIGTGVRDTGALAVSADSSGLNVKVAAGFAVVAGTAFRSTAIETLAIEANATSNPRTDYVILRRDFAATAGATVTLLVKKGTASVTAPPPALTQDLRGIWEEPLATVRVDINAATITAAKVGDVRAYCDSRVGTWTTAKRPTPRVGLLGFNTSTSTWELNTNGTAGGWTGLLAWANVTGKPTTFPPSTHSHAWGEITGKPTEFPPAWHGHDMQSSGITGVLPIEHGGTGAPSAAGARNALGAASTSHGHSLTDANITGTLPVNQGGTGATTADAALRALGIYIQSTAPAHSNGRVWIKRP